MMHAIHKLIPVERAINALHTNYVGLDQEAQEVGIHGHVFDQYDGSYT